MERGSLFEENAWARLPEVCRTQGEVQRGGGTMKEKERCRGRKGDREGENDKGTEAEENRKFREWRRGKDRSFEEDSGGIGGDAGRPARDDR